MSRSYAKNKRVPFYFHSQFTL